MTSHNLLSVAGLALCCALPAQAQTIAAWDFNSLALGPNNAPAASVGSGTATPLGMTNSYTYAGGVVGSVTTADVLAVTAGNNEWRVRGSNPGNGWNLAAPQFSQGAQFSVSTVGFSQIVFSYDWQSTNQGVRNLQALYTANGSTWTSVGALQVALPSTPITNLRIDFGALGIASVDNNANFAVRLVSAYDPSFASPSYTAATLVGGLPVAYNNNSGNWRFDNVSVSAVPEPGQAALLLAGLGALGFALRRRSHRAR